MRKRNKQREKELKQEKQARGLCGCCYCRIPEPPFKTCSRCREVRRARWPYSEKVRRSISNREVILEAKSKACVDCGNIYPPVCMDFDHLRDKKFSLGRAKYGNYSLEVIKAEIAKCEVVCANCHRIRTEHRRVA